MSNIAIKAENLSKAYQLGQIGTGTISRDFERWLARLRGKEDPFLKIGERNDQNTKSESNIVWSLQDINFEIEQGEAVGIIGKNGAGKSTLLKILSKVTAPTTGSVSGKGRIASLLEVGTGFHPELSGRENIFLNGAILGMRKKEIKRKLEEIVDFAGVEKYLDTPVKRYSSGMYVRLAFAVAAHLESEILIVDEVLAVGDAEFQKKCLGKMGEVNKAEGRSILFVSHNLNSIKEFCENTILLESGTITKYTDTNTSIKKYLKNNEKIDSVYFETEELILKGLELYDKDGKKAVSFVNGEQIIIKIEIKIKSYNSNFGFCIALYNDYGDIITGINTYHINQKIKETTPGDYFMEVTIPKYILNVSEYFINLHINDKFGNLFKVIENCRSFIITDDGFRNGDYFRGSFPGPIALVPEINFLKKN
ncbi:polysaccharide ABC transporter ATP-binding protein [Pedobacter agri]|uniref:ABC transporter ATP-binding protein n=1 Tax=Pedobacter agri TaxID=454586 RepID=UPI00292F7359|nr:polysaccharide ABC transporter ATP-binding protein [Pedobacter agri]